MTAEKTLVIIDQDVSEIVKPVEDWRMIDIISPIKDFSLDNFKFLTEEKVEQVVKESSNTSNLEKQQSDFESCTDEQKVSVTFSLPVSGGLIKTNEKMSHTEISPLLSNSSDHYS